MTRARGAKPDLLRHEVLLDMEEASGLPLRFCFIALFMACDREGRFQWRPRTLKAELLPMDNLDFQKVLEVLESGDFIRRYTGADGKLYGWVPAFTRHQNINPNEQKSLLPAHPDEDSYYANYTRRSRAKHAPVADECAPVADGGALRGKERKGIGKEQEEEGKVSPCEIASLPPASEEEAWQYAKNLPVAPEWTKAMVAQWWSDRDFRGWETASGTPVTAENWRKDLRNCHTWAQRALPRDGQPGASGTFPAPKKISGPISRIEEPAHVAGLLALVRQRKPDFTGTWQDVPGALRRTVQEEWDDALTENLTPA